MMSCSFLSSGQAGTYFQHEKDYYTKNLTNYDKWHGTLAETLGLENEVSKEQFDKMLDNINNDKGRDKRAALDCTFSAPKSVSLSLAKDQNTRDDMIKSHQVAVSKIANKIELELLQTRSNGKPLFSRNMIAAEFLHTMARPTKENDMMPDLDLHSHLVVMNKTFADGKDLAVDYGKIMNAQKIKELGLVYRQELAQELKSKGYELELTDRKQGFFEIKGFEREIIDNYSHRSNEIKTVIEKHDMTDMQAAKLYSRQSKEKGVVDFEKVCAETRKDLFENKKIVITKKESINHERQRANERSNQPSRTADIISSGGQSDIANINQNAGRGLEGFADRPSLSELPSFDVDAQSRRADLLLSKSAISRLAKLQSQKMRSHYLLRTTTAERKLKIDAITNETIKKLSAEKFAFSVPECRQRIMAAGVLESITGDEAKAAMERAEIVNLGRIEQAGKKSKDVYLTTEKNMEKEKLNIERMKAGKGTIKTNILTMQESKNALDTAEAKAKEKGLESATFTITDREGGTGEQSTAVHHILTSKDKYICVDGLAGTGKTTMMERLKWIADENGIEIKGVCYTGKAADGLQNESGIESQTIHSFLNKLEAGKYNAPTRADLLKKAAGEVVIETLNNGKIPPKDVPQPERSWSENLNRAAREVVSDAVLSGDNLKDVQKALQKEDRALYYQQESDRQKDAQNGIKQEWNFENVQKAKGREIWAIDEAGLVGTDLMHEVQKAAEARGAQVLLLGDPDQLPPVGAGEPMRQMEEAGMATAHLTDIRRQKDVELLQAVRESVKGDHLKTFEKLDKAGDYREVKDKTARQEAIKAEMTAEKLQNYKKNLLLVSTNADRKIYNKAIRAEYVKRGELGEGQKQKITVHEGEKDKTESRNFAVNDRIIFTANDNKLRVKNGTMAQIEQVDGNCITANTDAGKKVIWHMDQYNSIDHSYAVTGYKAQGMTVDKAVVDMNTNGAVQSRNALYVDISRAKQKAVVYTDDKKKLEKQTKDFAKKITSKDFTKKIETMRAQGGVKNNDRYHAPDQDKNQALEKALKQINEHTLARPKAVIEREHVLAQEKAAKLEKSQRQTIKKTVQHDTNRGFSR